MPGRGEYLQYCRRGHEFTEENTYISPKGERQCRACKKENQPKYNPQKRREQYLNNKTKNNQTSKEWYQKNKERHKFLRERWVANNYERMRVLQGEWYRRNKEELNARARPKPSKARRNSPRKISYNHLENSRKWAKENSEKKALYRRNRRAKLQSASGVASFEQVQARMAFHGWKCIYCGGPFQEVDHAFPISRGGGNWASNLVPSCRRCNREKHDKNIWQFLAAAKYREPSVGEQKFISRNSNVYLSSANKRGLNAPGARFNLAQIKEIRRLYASGEFSCRELGKRFTVNSMTISDIISYRNYTDVEDPYREACMEVLRRKSPLRLKKSYE